MKHRHIRSRCHRNPEHHVTKLGNRRVGQNALDVALLGRHESCRKAGDAAHPSNDFAGVGHNFENRKNAGQHVNSGRHHRRSVQKRGYRGRAFHRVRQPNVQRHLGGLANCAHENQYAGHSQKDGGDHEARYLVNDLLENNAPRRKPEKQDAEHETKIPDTIDNERLLAGICGRVFRVVVSDEDVGTHAHEFPKYKHHHEVARQNDAQHREKKEGQATKETRVTFLLPHVAKGISENQSRDGCDHQKHDLAQLVDREADRNSEVRTEAQPVIGKLLHSVGLSEHPPTQGASREGRAQSQGCTESFGEAAQQKNEGGGCQRGEKDNPGRDLRTHQNFSVLRSSTWVVCLAR